jgi:hypothetical protein
MLNVLNNRFQILVLDITFYLSNKLMFLTLKLKQAYMYEKSRDFIARVYFITVFFGHLKIYAKAESYI